jgi:hypothetical protein
MKYVTEDEKKFDDFDEAVAHEKSLPFLRLLNEVEEMAAKNTEFSLRLESLGRRLEKARLARPDGRLRAPKKGARPDAGSRESPHQSDAADGLPATNEEIPGQLEGESHEPINRNLPR